MASRWLAGTFALAKARAFANNRNTAAWFTCHLDPNRGKTLSTSWLKKVQPAAKKLLYSLSQIILVMLTSWSVIGWTRQLTIISGCHRWKFLVWTSLIGWMPRQSLSHPCCRGRLISYHSSMLPWSTNWAGSDISGAELRRCRLTPGGMSAAWTMDHYIYKWLSS